MAVSLTSVFCLDSKIYDRIGLKLKTNLETIMLNQIPKSYDLFFSVGAACSCTQMLRDAKLQIYSYPFDWMFGASLPERCRIVTNGFKDFLNQEDLVYTHTNNGAVVNPCDIYYNKRTKIVFNHDFPQNRPLSETYPAVSEKYRRRIQRLLNKIKTSRNCLAVYLETPNNENKHSDNDIIQAYEILKQSGINANLDFLYVAYSASLPWGTFKIDFINGRLTKITGNYKSSRTDDLPYIVEAALLKKIMQENFKLRLPLRYYIQKFILRLVINLIPLRQTRRRLKKKFHLKK